MPVAWQTHTAKAHEVPVVPALFDAMRANGFAPVTCAMDKGYDAITIYDECESRGIRPILPLRLTAKVVAGQHHAPSCEHGVWTFAGSDAKRLLAAGSGRHVPEFRRSFRRSLLGHGRAEAAAREQVERDADEAVGLGLGPLPQRQGPEPGQLGRVDHLLGQAGDVHAPAALPAAGRPVDLEGDDRVAGGAVDLRSVVGAHDDALVDHGVGHGEDDGQGAGVQAQAPE